MSWIKNYWSSIGNLLIQDIKQSATLLEIIFKENNRNYSSKDALMQFITTIKDKAVYNNEMIKAVYNNAYFIHCYGHQLNLIMKNSAHITQESSFYPAF